MFNTSLTDKFQQEMEKRANAWSGKPSLSYAISIPPELMWVIYQEFGINHYYNITGPDGVAFQGHSGLTILPSVIHPGLQPTHTIGTINEAMMNGPLQEAIVKAFATSGYQVEGTKAYLNDFMEAVKLLIVEQMATDLPGTRPADPQFPLQSGKLLGRTASEVFAENATVVNKD